MGSSVLEIPSGPELESWLAETTELLGQFVSIGAPTFHENRRSEFVEQWLRTHTNYPVERDETGNVWVDVSEGMENGLHLFDAHIDTVFPDEEVTIVREERHWRAPGILDNGACCVLLMTWLAGLSRGAVRLPVLVSFTVCEEGLGNLLGINTVLDRLATRLKDVWMFDLGLIRAARQALGSKRYQLSWNSPGGHSWNDFGVGNSLVEASHWLSAFARRFEWKPGVRSFNVGTMSGGTGVNVIAAAAECTLEIRSPDAAFLQSVDAWLHSPEAKAELAPGCTFTIECIGTRPAGELAADHRMVKLLESVHNSLALPLNFSISGTNANAAFPRGLPALTTGLASGGGIHTREEFLEIASLEIGAKKLTLLTRLILEADSCGN